MLHLSNIQKNKAERTKQLLRGLPSILSHTHISQNKAENLFESIDHFKSNKFERKFSYHLLSDKKDLVKRHDTTNL